MKTTATRHMPWATRLAAGLIVLATAAAFSDSSDGPFILDDGPSIPDNPTIRRLWPIGDALCPPNHGETVTGRPLLNLSLAVNYATSGLNVRGYHATNLAIHLAAALLLLGCCGGPSCCRAMRRRLGRGRHAAGPGRRPALGRASPANRVRDLRGPAGGVAGGAVLSADALRVVCGARLARPAGLVRLAPCGLPGRGWPARR